MYAIPSGVSPGVSFLPTERIARPFPPILLFPERRTVWRVSFHEWYTSGHPRLAIPQAMGAPRWLYPPSWERRGRRLSVCGSCPREWEKQPRLFVYHFLFSEISSRFV